MTRSVIIAIFFAVPISGANAQQFGGAVAVAGDEVFVGEVRNRTVPGEVYVYDRTNAWGETFRLVVSESVDGFGRALSSDGAAVLVGATVGGDASGAAHFFERTDDGSWTQTATLTPSDGEAAHAFGAEVLLHGTTAFVASPNRHNRTGAVYVFEREDDGTWTERALLAPAEAKEGTAFGTALAMDGSHLLVGGQNAAWVWTVRGDTWTEEALLAPDGLSARASFGAAVLLHGDRAFVGAPGAAGRQGAVFVWDRDATSGAWTESARLGPVQARRGAQFGAAVALRGDELWIGAQGGSGAIYMARQVDGMWSDVRILQSVGLRGRASFGATIALRGDVAAIGATGVDFREGAAVILEHGSADWTQEAVVISDMKGFDPILGNEVRCENGEAVVWSCNDVDLAAFLPLAHMGGSRGTRVNDIWGWTDPQTGREYALVGRTNGTSFVDITDAHTPRYVGDLPMTEGSRANVWRDIKVYRDHAFIVADGAGKHGVQVFDLGQLRAVTGDPVTFKETAHYDRIHSAHNIVINEDTGFAFSVGSSGGGETCGGGLHMIDVREPTEPRFAGCFADPTTGRRKTGYSHDAQCVIYHGPDTEHRGKEVCFGSNETAISISDVTDKENPVSLSMATYPKVAYTHQGWLTEDHRYFYMNDEGDEPQGLVEGTRTLVWDLADLDDPVLVKEYIAETTTTDHNLYIRGNLMYQSNYGSGLRILDITDPEDPVEVGFFDTSPSDAGGGSWSNYPYFDSGSIIVTSGSEGLFVVKKRKVDT